MNSGRASASMELTFMEQTPIKQKKQESDLRMWHKLKGKPIRKQGPQ